MGAKAGPITPSQVPMCVCIFPLESMAFKSVESEYCLLSREALVEEQRQDKFQKDSQSEWKVLVFCASMG